MNRLDYENPYYRSSGYEDESVPDLAIKAAGSLAPYSLGANLAGTALNAYGSYQQGNQAQKQYELQVRAFEAEKEREAREEERRRQQDYLDNAFKGGQYAQGVAKDAGDAYGSYARRMGL